MMVTMIENLMGEEANAQGKRRKAKNRKEFWNILKLATKNSLDKLAKHFMKYLKIKIKRSKKIGRLPSQANLRCLFGSWVK